MCSNEPLPTVKLQVWGPPAKGSLGAQNELKYTIELTNASLASIDLRQSDAKGTVVGEDSRLMLSFTYQKITWTFAKGGITATDSWESGN
jgi:type VI secretion system Hcp family effector